MSSRTSDPSLARTRVAVARRARGRRRIVARRRGIAAALVLLSLAGAAVLVRRDPVLLPHEIPGSTAWAREHYGNPDAPRFEARHIVEIDFLGRAVFVHSRARRHFLRLEALFEARAPE